MPKVTIGRVLNKDTDSVTVAQGPPNGAAWPVTDQAQLVPEQYDFIGLTYDPVKPDLVTQAVYRIGGIGGITVALLTITYDANDNIATVQRS